MMYLLGKHRGAPINTKLILYTPQPEPYPSN